MMKRTLEYPETHKPKTMAKDESLLLKTSVELLKIHGDGRCLYRALACHGNMNLQQCTRNSAGKPISPDLSRLEQQLSDQIRREVASTLESHTTILEKRNDGVLGLFCAHCLG